MTKIAINFYCPMDSWQGFMFYLTESAISLSWLLIDSLKKILLSCVSSPSFPEAARMREHATMDKPF